MLSPFNYLINLINLFALIKKKQSESQDSEFEESCYVFGYVKGGGNQPLTLNVIQTAMR